MKMKTTLLTITALISLQLSGLAFAQQDVAHGHGALEIFDATGQANTPQWVMIWIYFMAASFAAGLFFVKNHSIARWVVGGFVLGIVCMTILGKVLGLPPISGYIATIHILFWSPGLYQLLTKRPFLGEQGAFSIWSGIITFVILFSFVFDIRDAFIYLTDIF
jgi:hypothetical protein